jgi:DNA polymerase-4
LIACLSIPYFAAAVERRANSDLQQHPLAIGGQPWEARPVYAFSQEVAQNGVEIGMSLRLVQVLSPTSHFMPAAENRYSSVSGEVIDVLTNFSHLIEPQELWHPFSKSKQSLTAHVRPLPARYCLDLEGLPQREAIPFVQAMGSSVRQEIRIDPAIGLARQKFTAQVAASVCRTSHTLPVQEGTELSFLASRPLNFLPLEKEMARRLRLLGVYTMGQLASLSLPALQEQFGPQIDAYHRLARGEAGEPIHSPSPAIHEESEFLFDGPVANLQIIQTIGDRLVAELAHRLQTKALQGRKVHLVLQMEDDAPEQREVTLRRPTADALQLGPAVHELISSQPFPSAVTGLKIALPNLIPARARQLTLFAHPNGSSNETIPLQAQRAIDNLVAKYNQSRFFQPRITDIANPLPERRYHLHPLQALLP